jgi:hypothetical protein
MSERGVVDEVAEVVACIFRDPNVGVLGAFSRIHQGGSCKDICAWAYELAMRFSTAATHHPHQHLSLSPRDTHSKSTCPLSTSPPPAQPHLRLPSYTHPYGPSAQRYNIPSRLPYPHAPYSQSAWSPCPTSVVSALGPLHMQP